MSSNQLEAKGFFAALFDFGFTSFITLKFLRIIYTVLVGLILLCGAGFFIAFLLRGGFFVLVAVVLVPLVTLFYLVIARISLETVELFFRIGENTSLMAAAAGGAGPAGGAAYPPPTGPFTNPAPFPEGTVQ